MTDRPTGQRRPRVLITHQGCIPIYRKPLFERLARIEDIEYVVAYGDRPRGTSYIVAEPPFTFKTIRIRNYELPLLNSACIWQPIVGAFWHEFDAAILGDEIKYLSHLAIIASARLSRRPVMLWGFGYPSGQRPMPNLSLMTRIKRALKSAFRRTEFRLLDGYLAYTGSGADTLVATGMPRERIATVRNTVDVEKQVLLRAEAAGMSHEAIRTNLGVPADAQVLLYFGRFLPDKRVDMLIDYARRCAERGRNVHLIISGEGPEAERLRAQAQDLGNVVFRKLLDLDLAYALRIASAVVIAGFSGLAIAHAFAHGVPFLTRKGIIHPPEVDYIDDGVNGLMLDTEAEDFFAGLDRYLDDAELQARLRAGAEATAAGLSMDAMATNFDGLVRRLLQERGRMPSAASGALGARTAGQAM